LKVHVVTSCTDRKKVPVDPERRLRRLQGCPPESLACLWHVALLGGEPIPLRDLYAGEHWVEFLRIVDSSPRGSEIVGWVASAGCGLLPLHAEVPSYNATFSPGYPDSIGATGLSGWEWWQSLTRWEGLSPGSPRSIREIVERSACTDLVLVVASPTYLGAMRRDLQEACAVSASGVGAGLLIMGTGVPMALAEGFPQTVVTFNSGLQGLVGGSRIGLNIRVLSAALHRIDASKEAVRDWIGEMGRRYPAIQGPERNRVDDEAIARFIRARIAKQPGLRPSPLLREWRDQGMACEQARFGEIYRRIVTASEDRVAPDLSGGNR